MSKLVIGLAALLLISIEPLDARADEEEQLRKLGESAVLAAAQPGLSSPEGVHRLCSAFEMAWQAFRATRNAEAPVRPDELGFQTPGAQLMPAHLAAYGEFCAATQDPLMELSPATKLTVASGYNIRVTLGSALQRFRRATLPPPPVPSPPRPPSAYLPWAVLGATGLCALVSSAFLIDAFVRDNRRLDAANTGGIDRRTDESLRDALSGQKTGAGISTAVCAVGAGGSVGWLIWQRRERQKQLVSKNDLALRLDASPSPVSRGALFRVGLSF